MVRFFGVNAHYVIYEPGLVVSRPVGVLVVNATDNKRQNVFPWMSLIRETVLVNVCFGQRQSDVWLWNNIILKEGKTPTSKVEWLPRNVIAKFRLLSYWLPKVIVRRMFAGKHGRNQFDVNRRFVGNTPTSILKRSQDTEIHVPISIKSQISTYGDLSLYPRSFRNFKLLLRSLGLFLHLLPHTASYAGVPNDSRKGKDVDQEKIGFPPLKPMLAFLVGMAALGWGGWKVWISEDDTRLGIILGLVSAVCGVIVMTYGISGLTDWSLRF